MERSRQTAPFGGIRCDPDAVVFGDIRLPQPVLANGQPLVAGTYRVRMTSARPAPAAVQSPTASTFKMLTLRADNPVNSKRGRRRPRESPGILWIQTWCIDCIGVE